MLFSLFISFFACQSDPTELSEQVTNQIVQQVVKEVVAELESTQSQISTEVMKNVIQEEISKQNAQSDGPKFDPEAHRKELMSDRKSNRTSGEFYVRVTGVDAYPKSNFKSRMESAGRSKLKQHAQSKNIPTSSIDFGSMEVKQATCDGSSCSANFRASYRIK